FFFSSRRRHTRLVSDWSSDVCSSDLLGHEPSGIASAVFEATALTVYDTASSGVISRRLAEAVGAKSAAFVPLLVEERVTAVISRSEERRVGKEWRHGGEPDRLRKREN